MSLPSSVVVQHSLYGHALALGLLFQLLLSAPRVEVRSQPVQDEVTNLLAVDDDEGVVAHPRMVTHTKLDLETDNQHRHKYIIITLASSSSSSLFLSNQHPPRHFNHHNHHHHNHPFLLYINEQAQSPCNQTLKKEDVRSRHTMFLEILLLLLDPTKILHSSLNGLGFYGKSPVTQFTTPTE